MSPSTSRVLPDFITWSFPIFPSDISLSLHRDDSLSASSASADFAYKFNFIIKKKHKIELRLSNLEAEIHHNGLMYMRLCWLPSFAWGRSAEITPIGDLYMVSDTFLRSLVNAMLFETARYQLSLAFIGLFLVWLRVWFKILCCRLIGEEWVTSTEFQELQCRCHEFTTNHSLTLEVMSNIRLIIIPYLCFCRLVWSGAWFLFYLWSWWTRFIILASHQTR